MENKVRCIFLCMLIMDTLEMGHSTQRVNASEVVLNGSTSYALIPYTPGGGVLSQFYEPEKAFNFPNLKRSIVIRQDWSSNGVAGVVWEAVSCCSSSVDFLLRLRLKLS